MRWHKNNRVEMEDMLRHPVDIEGWKHFDSEFPKFALDPRNISLGLASDEFNHFGHMSTTYSMCHVVLIHYNLPPLKCMKESNLFTLLLIPEPRSPDRKIDVYLQPLIEELKQLWSLDVCTYDSLIDQFFQLYATLLWTINDFSAYGDLSKWSTKGYQVSSSCFKWACYLGKTRFPGVLCDKDERNDDSIPEDEIVGEFKVFMQKMKLWSTASTKHLRSIRHQASSGVDLFKRHQQAFSDWFRDQDLHLTFDPIVDDWWVAFVKSHQLQLPFLSSSEPSSRPDANLPLAFVLTKWGLLA
ncbi:uncharacterized protein E5676_scaffold1359G00160 [Cucumis melo var. makuwa]|uniref:Uncharacterized protein n=1 Tax=Cucumis melo var. makuwa TaxID=1194695 RepID=A0A5A7UR74_CUCMM|nr:uncharacterized protein E6C27_scaffold409G00780 [Cucumis melo var. makuwa]TYK23418.1 uncharacterized protein E5676_scaffold1359G00160 [Cucumis melo var. makuwa]